MLHNKRVVFLVVLIMVAIAAISVQSVFAAGFDKMGGDEHAPVCYQLETFGPGMWGLQCFDEGKDIIDAGVKTNVKYDLYWDEESVILYVYPIGRHTRAEWYVMDKNGSYVSGTFR